MYHNICPELTLGHTHSALQCYLYDEIRLPFYSYKIQMGLQTLHIETFLPAQLSAVNLAPASYLIDAEVIRNLCILGRGCIPSLKPSFMMQCHYRCHTRMGRKSTSSVLHSNHISCAVRVCHTSKKLFFLHYPS